MDSFIGNLCSCGGRESLRGEGGKSFGVFHLETGFYVIDNQCPHKGAPLHEGFVQNGVVVCPWHQWEFQVSDGKCLSLPNQAVETYKSEVRNQELWVEITK